GGVVTQRTANPCTPVRFRARPPNFPDMKRRKLIFRIPLGLTSRLPTQAIFALSSLEDTPPSPKRLCGSLWLPPSSLGLGFHTFQRVRPACGVFSARAPRCAIERVTVGGYTPASNRAP